MNSIIATYIVENQQRLSVINSEYDPITGKGSPIPRIKIYTDYDKYMMIPKAMGNEDIIKAIIKAKTLKRLVKGSKISFNDATKQLWDLRLKYDFELWAFIKFKIQDKKTFLYR